MRTNGLLASLWSPPWFTPAWCAGSASYADPQAAFYAPIQWFSFFVNPFLAAHFSALLFAAVAFWGSYALARKIFDWEAPASTVFAVLGIANALMPLRSAVGETGYHSFYLWTFLVMALAWPDSLTRWRKALPPAAVAACITAWLQFGFGATLVPASLGVLALLSILIATGRARWSTTLVRGSLGVAGAVLLNASKVYESASLLRNFPRDFYAMPGFPSLFDALISILMGLTQPSEWSAVFAAHRMERVVYMVLPHEWALQFGLGATLLCLASLCILLASRRSAKTAKLGLRAQGVFPFSALIGWLVAAIVATIPVLLLWSAPAVQSWIKSIPLLSSTTWPMRWIIVYIPLVQWLLALPVAMALRTITPKLVGPCVFGACILIWTGPATEPMDYYASPAAQGYDPRPVARAHAQLVATGIPIPIQNLHSNFTRTGQLTANRNDAMLTGGSQIECYNPLYGYRLESFPQHQRLREGPALGLDATGHSLIMNPACLVHPEANQCAPGDGFDMSSEKKREQAILFMQRKPFEWSRSPLGTALSWVSVVSWIFALALLVSAVALTLHDYLRAKAGLKIL